MKTQIIKVHAEFPEREKIARCAGIVRQGGLVIFPTETVYGIAADVNNPEALKRLRKVKRRSEDKPFTVMISQKEAPIFYSGSRDPRVFKLIDRYWPGPLTVILPAREEGKTVGMRMPAHLAALYLVQASGGAVAAPSANFEGHPPPETCAQALQDLNGLVDAALDAGPSDIGQASTIVNLTRDEPSVVREGSIAEQDIREVMGKKTILVVCTGNSCRSVMAEYLLRDKLKDRRDIEVVSAGTSVFVRSGASSGALKVLKIRGLEAHHHRSQPINKILLYKADMILVMSTRHRQAVLQSAPEAENKTHMLKEFIAGPAASLQDLDIMDPMGREDAAYEECARIINMSLDQVVKTL